MERVAGAGRDRPRLLTPAFLLITFSALAYFMSVGIMMPILPKYVEDALGGGSVAVGLAVGAFSITAIMVRPFIGRLGDRRGRKILIVGGAALVAAAIAGFEITEAMWVVVLMRLIAGVGEAAFFVGAASAVNDLAPDERRGEAVSLFSLSLYSGLAFGPVLGEAVFKGGHFGAVWVAGALGAALSAAIALKIPDTRPAREATPGQKRLLHPAALRPGVIILMSVWAFAGFTSFMPLYARNDLGLNESGPVFLVFSIVIILFRSLGARIPDHFGAARTATVSLAISSCGLLVVASWADTAGLYAGAVLFGAGQSLAFPALMSIAVRAAPAAERGSVVGTFTAFVDLGFALGPITLGGLAAVLGYRGAFVGGATIAAAGFSMMLARARRASGRTPEPFPLEAAPGRY